MYVDTTNARTLVWVDRTGKEEAIAAAPRAYLQPRLSPDGRRIAVWSNDQANDIWIWDLEKKTLTPLTLDPGEDQHPLSTHDGKRDHFQLEPERRERRLQSLVASGRRHRQAPRR